MGDDTARADSGREGEVGREELLPEREPEAKGPPAEGQAPRGGLAREAIPVPPDTDVMLQVPRVKVDEIDLEVDNLRARVSLSAKVGNLVSLDVGADVGIERVELTIKGVEAEALLLVRLEKVFEILDRTLATIDRNPEILRQVLKPVGEAVGATGQALAKTVGGVGEGLSQTVPKLGGAAGDTLSQTAPKLGDTLSQTVPRVGNATGETLSQTVPRMGGAASEVLPQATQTPRSAAGDRSTQHASKPAGGAARGASGPNRSRSDGSGIGKVSTWPRQAGRAVRATTQAAGEWLSARRTRRRDKRAAEATPTELLTIYDGTDEAYVDWRLVGAGELRHGDGELRISAGTDRGLAYFAPLRFGDFRLKFQYRPEDDCDASVAIRFLDPEQPVPDRDDPSVLYPYDNQAYVAGHTGYTVFLGPSRPGSEPGTFEDVSFGDAPGAQRQAERSEVKSNDWNQVEIDVEGDNYSVRLNGKESALFANTDSYRGRPSGADPRAGFVGIAIRKGRIALRQVQVEARTPAEAAHPGPAEEGEREVPTEVGPSRPQPEA